MNSWCLKRRAAGKEVTCYLPVTPHTVGEINAEGGSGNLVSGPRPETLFGHQSCLKLPPAGRKTFGTAGSTKKFVWTLKQSGKVGLTMSAWLVLYKGS